MKRLTFITAVAALFAAAATSCADDPADDPIWDFAPYDIVIRVCDSDGNSLLDPAANGTAVGEEMSMDYEDETYEVAWFNKSIYGSRYLPAFFHGFRHGKDAKGQWCVTFGEFPRDATYAKQMTLHFGGQAHEIALSNTIEWKHDEPFITTLLYCDGKECPDGTVTLTLTRNKATIQRIK